MKPPSSIFPWHSQVLAPLGRLRAALHTVGDFRIWLGVTALGLLAAAAVFTLYTHNIWEDYLITLRFSQNLVEGNGLVYHVGERVHGFTSVINTLLPALFLWLGGVENYEGALAGYRIVSVLTLIGGTTVLLYALHREGFLDPTGRWVFSLLLVLDFKLIAFACNGMETGFLVGFLMVAIALTLRGIRRHWIAVGMTWAALLYTRPDTPLLMLGLAGVALSLHRENWRAELGAIVKAGLVCAILYLPWLLWVWSYYGSPIPHTIIAKAAHGAEGLPSSWYRWLLLLWSQLIPVAGRVFLPAYASPGLWWQPAAIVAMALVAPAATACLWFRGDRATRALSAMIVLLLGYLAFQQGRRNAYPWYFPPTTLVASLVLARLASLGGTLRLATPLKRAMIVGVGGVLLISWGLGAHCMRIQQLEIEEHGRKQLGLWLRTQVAAGETVFVEPLGYLGYFSRARMVDYPGLVSPQTVAAINATDGSMGAVIARLAPDWMILRPKEARAIFMDLKTAASYEPVASADAEERLSGYGGFVGKEICLHDAQFTIYRRRAEPKGQP
mgnify:CR=1 FL=1